MFQGFYQGTVDFLWGIRFNNERSWFLEHKQEYLDLVDRPLRALGGAVYERMAEDFPQLGLNLHVSRIYRDARRLYGRGPYKDHLWLTLRCPKEGWSSIPSFYFGIAPEYYCYGVGCYDASPRTMAKFRARIDRDPKSMEQLARRLNESRFTLAGPMYKRSKGDPGELLTPWYNRKSIDIIYEDNCEGVFFTPELVQEVVEGFHFLVPYYQYFDALMGDPEPGTP